MSIPSESGSLHVPEEGLASDDADVVLDDSASDAAAAQESDAEEDSSPENDNAQESDGTEGESDDGTPTVEQADHSSPDDVEKEEPAQKRGGPVRLDNVWTPYIKRATAKTAREDETSNWKRKNRKNRPKGNMGTKKNRDARKLMNIIKECQ